MSLHIEKAVALFDSLRASVLPTSLPQPVGARNTGLVEAWQTWLSKYPDGRGAAAMNDWMNSVQCRLDDAIGLFRHALQGDPGWQKGRAAIAGGERGETAVITMGAAPLMFWSRQHILIESTPALEQLLVHSDIGEDLPVNLFRAPAPACFLRFGQIFQDGLVSAPEHQQSHKRRLTGVYVFDGRNQNTRSIDLVCVFLLPAAGIYSLRTIELVFHDENESVLAQIRRACQNAELEPHLVSIAQSVAKVFFYMQQPGAHQVEERQYSATLAQLVQRGSRKAAKLSRKVMRLYDRVVIGPAGFVHPPHGELSPHLRRGHFRLQPYGPESSLRKVIFLAPTWVRGDRLLNN
ncbi:hypothetical protein [Massilia sp. TSP1-1-2]|uniref:hypothetical protein n=1 Tax=Massilia sp. TSP1-1-2 TaxID=2804649 RepID=UPI003CFB7022